VSAPIARARLGSAVDWLARRDPNYAALRRAGRTAIIMPALFAFCFEVIGNAEVATYAAFGSIALLMLVDYTGPTRARLQAEASLAVAGAVLVCLGTLTSRTLWLSVVLMALMAFFVLFSGVMSSVIASSSTSLLLVFILSTAVAGPVSSIPDRLAGWGLASFVALFAVWLMWPLHNPDPLRRSAAAAARALARRLRADVAHWRGDHGLSDADYEAAIDDAHRATQSLHRGFLNAPSRPTGLSVSSRASVRLVDELLWLDALVEQSARPTAGAPVHRHDCEIRSSSAAILETGADALDDPSTPSAPLTGAREELRRALEELERSVTATAPFVGDDHASPDAEASATLRNGDEDRTQFVDSLEPSFRAQEIGFVATLVGANVDLVSSAERRGWLDTVVGLVPGDPSSRLSAARARASAHLDRHSVWLHNSLRGAVGLAIAVFIAEKTGVQHAFWVILGTLSVLRSNAVNTGTNALRAVLGTAIGVVLGAALLGVVGSNVTVLWFLLPVAIVVAGFAPTAISFAAGQAGFTLTLVILWNILQPIGWKVGLYRIEDIAIGCAVSVGVGLFFWPRGAAAALGATLREAYETSASFFVAAVTDRSTQDGPPRANDERERAAAAARRLDDAFRTYLGERGSKPIPVADLATLVRGVVSLRQSADAVVDLWAGASRRASSRALDELDDAAGHVARWYDAFAAALDDEGPVPEPVAESPEFDQLLVDSVDDDLRHSDGDSASTDVRLVWTRDYLGVVRRLEGTLVGPARSALRRAATRGVPTSADGVNPPS
jgi:uncharacterized membrane protein YccC